MAVAKIRFETNGSPAPNQWKLHMNGNDITLYVRSIKFEAGVDRVTRATIELTACEVEMPDALPLIVNIDAAD